MFEFMQLWKKSIDKAENCPLLHLVFGVLLDFNNSQLQKLIELSVYIFRSLSLIWCQRNKLQLFKIVSILVDLFQL